MVLARGSFFQHVYPSYSGLNLRSSEKRIRWVYTELLSCKPELLKYMNQTYVQKLTKLINQASSNLSTSYRFEFKNVFGAVGGYVNGRIFITCGKFGVALKLPPDILDRMFQENEAKPLKYFANGHIKKEYALLSNRILENKKQLKTLVDKSIKYVLSQ